MNEYYFTFGVQYAYERHPVYTKADPDRYVTIVADNENQARQYFVDHVGGLYFATSYTESNFDDTYFPKGEIERFTVHG